ncbi:unnamed protein product [Ilex paraguariensis]|uniref:Uncharacterized protein n=1 Tax=Ilex paraguariensis TaxID=185542 RepID=A0ABC8U8R6_9AQUA
MDQPATVVDRESLEKRPGILFVGSPNVGKRTLLSGLLSLDFEDASDSSSDVLAYGWTIDTKYYTADVCVWMAHLHDEFSDGALPKFDQLAALVMVFDMSDLSSFAALKDWVSRTDIQNFDILLCIGNKVDLLPGHAAHVEYRRHLLKLEESSVNPYPEFSDHGIAETEGISLLGDDESLWEAKSSCMEWCIQHNIEYIEACGSNADFDKCLSVDGDSQGVERLYGALSAHMWPGMILKSGDKINEPSLPEQQGFAHDLIDLQILLFILSNCLSFLIHTAQSYPKKNRTLKWSTKSYLRVQQNPGMTQMEDGSQQLVLLQPMMQEDRLLRISMLQGAKTNQLEKTHSPQHHHLNFRKKVAEK